MIPAWYNDKRVSAGIAALGIIALALAGFLRFTTPGEQACKAELSDLRVKCAEDQGNCKADIADARARLELLTEAKNACKDALDVLTGKPDVLTGKPAGSKP